MLLKYLRRARRRDAFASVRRVARDTVVPARPLRTHLKSNALAVSKGSMSVVARSASRRGRACMTRRDDFFRSRARARRRATRVVVCGPLFPLARSAESLGTGDESISLSRDSSKSNRREEFARRVDTRRRARSTRCARDARRRRTTRVARRTRATTRRRRRRRRNATRDTNMRSRWGAVDGCSCITSASSRRCANEGWRGAR